MLFVLSPKNNFLLPKESDLNIFSVPKKNRKNPLMEGYFASYPVGKIIHFLNKRYGEQIHCVPFENENKETVLRIIIPNNEHNKKMIDADMRLCGYYPSIILDDGDKLDIQYEARYQNKVNEIVYSKKYIYHITPSKHIEKIKNIGLSPRSESKLFEYPERIYFFLTEPDDELCKQVAETLNYFSKKKSIQYDLLAIDVSKIGKKDFFYDPNADDCVYTKENIKPDAISIVKDFRI